MNIHFKNGVTSEIAVDRTSKQVKSSDVPTLQGASQDRATLSTSGQTVSSLVKAALSTPATRQDKVDSIRNSLMAGTYPIDSMKIAGAMLSGDVE